MWLSCMETFPTFAIVVWDLICWPVAAPGVQGSVITSGIFYLMYSVTIGHILSLMWKWASCPNLCDLKLDNWNLIHLKELCKTTQVFHMDAALLLNRSITQAGEHYPSWLIHPTAEWGNDPRIIIDFSVQLLASNSMCIRMQDYRYKRRLCFWFLRKRQTVCANSI